MPTSGSLTYNFNRVYIYLNPDPYKGPFTQRLSNLVPVTDLTGDLDNLYGIAPIISTQTDTTAALTFSIDGITKNVSESRSTYTQEEVASNLLNYAPFKSERAFKNISKVTSIAPVSSSQSGRDAVVWFDITNLPNIDEARSARKLKVFLNLPYNSRSITAITATAPLEVTTVNEIANVSFDITSLPPA